MPARAFSAAAGIALAIALAATLLIPSPASGLTYTVDTAADTGTGSLRQAILDANANAGPDVIDFSSVAFPPGNPATIMPATALPASTDPAGLTIDGTGAGVIIDGSALNNEERGLDFHSTTGVALSDVTVSDVTVQNFPDDGIRVCGGDAVSCDAQVADVLIQNVTANGNGEYGIHTNGRPNLRSSVVDSTANDNGSRGINLNGGNLAHLQDASVTGVTANGNGDRGINLNSGDNNINSSVQNSSTTGNGNTGININASDETINPTVSGSESTGNAGDGIVLNGGDPSFGATVTGNTSTGNSADGIGTDTSGLYSNNIFSNNSGDGFSAREVDITISGSTISGNSEHAIDGNNSGGLTITGNTISGNLSTSSAVRLPGTNNVVSDNLILANSGDGIDGSFAGAGSDTVSGNTVSGNAGIGVAVAGGNNIVSQNTVSGNSERGIRAGGANNTITFNTVTNNTQEGIVVFEAPSEVHFNRIFGNGSGALGPASVSAFSSPAGVPVDAENNWWGCNEGPSSPQCDSAAGNLDFDPWLTLSIAANPNPAIKDQVGAIQGLVTTNSDSADTSGEGTIPDNTVITFDTDIGFLDSDPANKPTANGVAQSAFVSDQVGTANLTATLDNETVFLALAIVEGEFTPTPTPTPTDGPTASPTPSGTAAATPTPAPTDTPGPGLEVAWGDANCSGDADPVDALLTLRDDAGLSTNTGDCPDFGTPISILASALVWGDIDCSGGVDPVDALKLLRFDAALGVNQPQGCPALGAEVTIAVD